MYALREYVGAGRVNAALRRLLETHAPGTAPLPTSLDLYKEIQAVTPDSLQYLLVDLFEANTFWELAASRVTAKETQTGASQVEIDVRARKVVVWTTAVSKPRCRWTTSSKLACSPAAEVRAGEAEYWELRRVLRREADYVIVRRRPPSPGSTGGTI